MGPRNSVVGGANGVGRVRARVLSELHVGRLRPGDRVLSVRRLAALTGVNHKTVHRAYTALARDGILDVRPGSGTFVTERRSDARELPPTDGLVGAMEQCRTQATQLGLRPETMSRFLGICLTDGLRGVPVGVVECNDDQIAMIGRDLVAELGIEIVPVRLHALEHDAPDAVGSLRRVVTTDCHYSQVAEVLEPMGIPVYTVTLDTEFPREVLRAVRDSSVIMVVHDIRFGDVFKRLLRQTLDDETILRRIRFVTPGRAGRALRDARPGTRVYVSPGIAPAVADAAPGNLGWLRRCWHVESGALDAVRAGLALDLALQP